jgi:ribosomal protein S1
VSLDDAIHGLAHVSQLKLSPKDKINEKFKAGDKVKFEIVSIEPKDHRLGLAYGSDKTVKEIDKKEEVRKEEAVETGETEEVAAPKKVKKETKEKKTAKK